MDQKDEINKAAEIVKQGGIIIFPTDTAFGIGCRIDNDDSVSKLYKIRKRPKFQAVPVLVSSVGMAQRYLLSPLPNDVRRLMNDNWPGSLTIIYGCITNMTPLLVRGGGKTLGVRMPKSDKITEIIESVGVPILGPSANFHGESTPYSYCDLNPELVKLVDFVVQGETTVKQASTVIDTTVSPWKILRQGKILIDLKKYEI